MKISWEEPEFRDNVGPCSIFLSLTCNSGQNFVTMWDFVLISNFHHSNNPWCQVGIQHVMASFLPGHYFPQGRHHVLYQVDSSKQNVFSLFGVFLLFQCFCSQAADGDGNRARCGFTITVKPQPTFNPLQVSVGCFTLTVHQPSIRYKELFVDIC